jgi:Ca2+-binding EF-hand superfamily protein
MILCKKNGKKLCKYEIELLMDRFDKNKDGIIDFDEFFNEIKPKI